MFPQINLKTKSTDGYKKYIDKDPSYAGKGHIASRTVVEEGSLWSSLDVAQKDFSIPEMQKEYLREIIEFCNKNEIQLTFFSVPTTDFHLAFITNYDEYVKDINDFMSEYDIKYYDFNLCNQDVLKLDKDSLYNDDNHLNTVGAKHFSTVFADYFMGRIQREDLFYDSYEMKLKESTPRLLGLQIKMSDLNNTNISVTPITSHSGMQVECDQEYIYFFQTGVRNNWIFVYDWDGHYWGKIPVPMVGESENLFVWNDGFIAAFNNVAEQSADIYVMKLAEKRD